MDVVILVIGKIIELIFWCIAGVGALILLFAFCVGVYRGVRKWFPAPVRHEVYGEEAVKAGMAIYKDEPALDAEERLAAFKDGALWGWAFYHGTHK
jgi:hypothetical protein